MVENRFLPTDGIHNLRDYGGYAVAEGGRVKNGLLFRSGQHKEATDKDLSLVDALDIRTIVDLRGNSERAGFPCRRSENFTATVIHHDGETASSPPHEAAAGKGITPEMARQRMLALYTRMPVNPAMISMFGRYFKSLDERDGGNLVHCFAGKDRTGIAASMLLQVLGVHHDDVVGEFMLTNEAPTTDILIRQSLPRMEAHYGPIDEEAVRNLMGVRPEYVETYISEVTHSHGSFDGYISDIIGVDEAMRERLKARFIG
ncbi:MAG: tyrosine-protein phosphatase [Erythrobacter sp.]